MTNTNKCDGSKFLTERQHGWLVSRLTQLELDREISLEEGRLAAVAYGKASHGGVARFIALMALLVAALAAAMTVWQSMSTGLMSIQSWALLSFCFFLSGIFIGMFDHVRRFGEWEATEAIVAHRAKASIAKASKSKCRLLRRTAT